jgi:hypothetical protein
LDETLTEVAHEFSLNSGQSAVKQPSLAAENEGIGADAEDAQDWMTKTRGFFANGCKIR